MKDKALKKGDQMLKKISKIFFVLGMGLLFLSLSNIYSQESKSQIFDFKLSAQFGDRNVFEFEVQGIGMIEAEATWTGAAPTLSLILNGPGGSAYARQDGKSPLKLAYNLTQADLNLGTKWKISIVNFSRKGSAQGNVKIKYPIRKTETVEAKVVTETVTKLSEKATGQKEGVLRGRVKAKPKVYMQGINLKTKYLLKRNYALTKELRFDTSRNEKPLSYRQFLQKFPIRGKLKAKIIDYKEITKIGLTIPRIYSPQEFPNGKVIIAVNSDLYSGVSASLRRYVDDIATQGYFGIIHLVDSTGTPEELRDYLGAIEDIAGVVLVGNLPVAWYEHDKDFCGPGQPMTCHAEWPCDLFFMDLDGTWQDQDGDGIFDSHTGNTAPEIFLGRIAAYTLTGNEATLVNDYFAKDHRFRTGEAGFSARGITFIDDDWSGLGKSSMDLYLDIVEDFTDQDYTNADNYKNILQRRLAWLQLCCHSSPTLHHFHKNKGKDDAGFVFNNDIQNTNRPQAFFHNLFCCSSANFTVGDYIAGWYTFGQSFGLCTVGSTKTGSMQYFEYFYGALNEGLTNGEALVGWWDSIQPIDSGKRAWHYGMTLIGDPLLNWRVGAIPHSLNPGDGSRVPLPGQITFSWSPITTFGAVKYKVEVEFWDSGQSQWKLHGGTDTVESNITLNLNRREKYRWRVKVLLKEKWGPWSYWQYIQPQ
jgi:hypothetical protein